ncbi:lipocalin-like domain-containing protein (plasmid) [Skermanella rosea]|uniref:lipocalin-like domain-containing protein n=1 Tax=Skermanella rosea TaxID=1817965 RepID=UPI001931D444|nr:lipocalin-like domain-containing protein [Skermanella rosea]UEM07539.1 lipocalin-like domain-containing protein [Skermanella rosea]
MIQGLRRSLLVASALAVLFASAATAAENKILGSWRVVSAVANPETDNILPYGPKPQGMLVFAPDMHYIAVLHDPRIPRFGSDARGGGTAEENAAAMAGAIGFYGTYTVDENGEFSGNTVEGSTFPNWIGSARTTEQLRLTVDGDRMRETFTRPGGLRIVIEWERVR